MGLFRPVYAPWSFLATSQKFHRQLWCERMCMEKNKLRKLLMCEKLQEKENGTTQNGSVEIAARHRQMMVQRRAQSSHAQCYSATAARSQKSRSNNSASAGGIRSLDDKSFFLASCLMSFMPLGPLFFCHLLGASQGYTPGCGGHEQGPSSLGARVMGKMLMHPYRRKRQLGKSKRSAKCRVIRVAKMAFESKEPSRLVGKMPSVAKQRA